MRRRDFLAVAGAAAAVPMATAWRSALAQSTVVRQGYQTNMWGMATYYFLRSGAPEKQGLKFEEFAVPSGNLTMQQMVGRQVDLGTYAGPSFILGHARGGLVAIAQIEQVGRTVRVMARKELGLKRIEDLKGRKVADQVGSSVSAVFTDIIAPKHGLKPGEWQQVRMNVNDMVAAMAAKTVDAMINVEPYNAIAEADGLATTIMDYWDVDRMPVFMAATPDFVTAHPEETVRYLKAWLAVAEHFKNDKKKVSETIYGYYKSKGYQMSQSTFDQALGAVEVDVTFPGDLKSYMQQQAETLLHEKKIKQMPDWSKALRPEFMQKAKA
ncbi:MAG TPA: ABC transporter substrate-binding protein [Burkholderiales bacterium]|jgi:ABC-type nitrate/sulfonate/bicarbonate transport system substrate-binding protein|nr:ABC transporter substrate-binding protein [Burkholderiales bacterium]